MRNGHEHWDSPTHGLTHSLSIFSNAWALPAASFEVPSLNVRDDHEGEARNGNARTND